MISFEPLDYYGPEIKNCFYLIISRTEGLERYNYLKREILDLLQNPNLKALEQYHPEMTEQLYQAGFIVNPLEFENYLRETIKGDHLISFLTAPGSRMTDHHSYPGGLVYHTAVDIEMALSMAEVYQRIYNIDIDRERLIVALALHDIAKVTVFPWDSRGEYPDETKIAGTEGHHIFSISEAIHRDFPLPVIQAMAFCHNRIVPPEKGLTDFLKAAYLIAGKEYPAACFKQITIEDWICLYADSDWMISSWAIQKTIQKAIKEQLERFELYKLLASRSEFSIFQQS